MARESSIHTILDDDGNEHEYGIHPHAAGAGFKLATELFGLVGGSLGALLNTVMGAGSLKAVLATDLSAIDFGAAINDLAMSIASSDTPGLARRLLRHTVRDGKPLTKQAHFDAAFEANYGELAEALALSVEVNRFVGFFKRSFSSAAARLPATGNSPSEQ